MRDDKKRFVAKVLVIVISVTMVATTVIWSMEMFM